MGFWAFVSALFGKSADISQRTLEDELTQKMKMLEADMVVKIHQLEEVINRLDSLYDNQRERFGGGMTTYEEDGRTYEVLTPMKTGVTYGDWRKERDLKSEKVSREQDKKELERQKSRLLLQPQAPVLILYNYPEERLEKTFLYKHELPYLKGKKAVVVFDFKGTCRDSFLE